MKLIRLFCTLIASIFPEKCSVRFSIEVSEVWCLMMTTWGGLGAFDGNLSICINCVDEDSKIISYHFIWHAFLTTLDGKFSAILL